eukprot:8329982-Ditylum_brightwellii.AAC.1
MASFDLADLCGPGWRANLFGVGSNLGHSLPGNRSQHKPAALVLLGGRENEFVDTLARDTYL